MTTETITNNKGLKESQLRSRLTEPIGDRVKSLLEKYKTKEDENPIKFRVHKGHQSLTPLKKGFGMTSRSGFQTKGRNHFCKSK